MNKNLKNLFTDQQHYLGKPADFEDRIVLRRIRLVEQIPYFLHPDIALLDIGCGNGASMFALASKVKSCLGLDINDQHLSAFLQFKQQYNILNCEYKVLNIEKQPIQEQYERIISFEVIEHLENEDNVKFYYDALKKGGLMAISVPNKWWIFETHGAKLPWLPWNRVPFFSWLPKSIHERYANARIYTMRRIRTLLEKHGFHIVNMQYITAPMDVLPNGKIKNFIIKYFFGTDTTIFPFKSTAIFVAAKKI